MNPLVPAPDPTPLPGPTWLFHLLWVITFTIHLVMVNAVLGGTILSAVALRRGRAGAGRGLAAWFASINTWAISFAITFAIAPLLFAQLLYGRFFYSATILLAGAWLTLLGLLTAAYYLNYIVKRRLRDGGTPTFLVCVQALLFLTIAGIQVAVSLLHQRPSRWVAVSDRPWSALGDPAFVPRYLHFVFAAVAMAGGALVWWRMRRRGPDPVSSGGTLPFGDTAPFGGRRAEERVGDRAQECAARYRQWNTPARFVRNYAALGATALQIPVGFWMLFAVPSEVLFGFMKGGPWALMPLTLGVLTGVAAIVLLTLCLSPLAQPSLVRHAMELITGTMVLMVITRHQLRGAYLKAENFGASPAVAPQWSVIGLFLLCLLGAGGLSWIVLRRAVRDRPGPGEDAA